MPDVERVASREEIPQGQGKVVEIAGRAIALFNVDGKFFAVDNTCLHQGGPLGEGHLQGAVVNCPWHMWGFNVTTGLCEVNPEFKLQTHPVKLEGEEILVGIEG